ISAVLGNILPGPGTLYNQQTLSFVGRAHAGEELVVRVRVVAKEPQHVVRLATSVERADGTPLVEGEAVVVAPERKQSFDDLGVPGLLVHRHVHFDRLIEQVASLDPMLTAVVAPEDPNSLGGALRAAEEEIITPVLIGARPEIERAAATLRKDISRYEI